MASNCNGSLLAKIKKFQDEKAKGMDVQVKLSCDVAFGILSLKVD